MENQLAKLGEDQIRSLETENSKINLKMQSVSDRAMALVKKQTAKFREQIIKNEAQVKELRDNLKELSAINERQKQHLNGMKTV